MTSTRAGTFAAVSGTTMSASAEAGESRFGALGGHALGRCRCLRAAHVRLLLARFAQPRLDRLRRDRRPLVRGLRHDLAPLPAGRALLSRSVAEHRERGEAIGEPCARRRSSKARSPLGLAIVTLALRGPIEDEPPLRQRDPLLDLRLAVALLRGQLLRPRLPRRQPASSACSPGCSSASRPSRTLFAVALALGIAEGQDAVALGIAAAPLFSLLVVPLAFRRGDSGRSPASSASPPGRPGQRQGRAGQTFAQRRRASPAAVFWIMLAEQTLLNGGPLLVRGLEDAAAAGFIFNVLMLARAPLLVFQGVAISLLPHLTRLRSRGDGDRRRSSTARSARRLTAIAALHRRRRCDRRRRRARR